MIFCQECDYDNPRGADYCEDCGTQLEATEAAERAADVEEAALLLKKTKRAGKILLAVAVLGFFSGLHEIADVEEDMRGVAAWVVVIGNGPFFILWLWSRRRPLAAGIVGLVLYVGTVLLSALGNPSYFFRGLIHNTLIIASVMGAISTGFKYREFVRERGLD